MDQIRQIIRQELARLLGEGVGITPPAAGGWPQAPAQTYGPPAAGGWAQGGDSPAAGAGRVGLPAAQPGARSAAEPGGANRPPGEAQGGRNLQEDYRELTQAMSQNLQKLQFVLQETSEITRKVEQLLWEASRAEQKLRRGR